MRLINLTRRILTPCVVLVAALTAGGCASIDYDYPRTPSYALTDTENTYYGESLGQLAASKPADMSGFHPLIDGIDSFSARLLLASRAERSIDLQYYLIKNDITGKALIDVLLQAADRGVRVRLLLDDVFTEGYDVGLAALDSHPNFEIRIFNPFYRGFGGRLRSGFTNFGRINRRMHNKSFTVDNRVTVVGGRNIADEYFGAREDAKFSDLDVLAVGPVVQDVSTMFDTYWNHETALPLPAFLDVPDDPATDLDEIRDFLKEERARVGETKYADAVRAHIVEYIHSDSDIFLWAPYELVYDSPDKGIKSKSKDADSIVTPLAESLQSATTEAIVVSPYFVPRKSGVEWFVAMADRGVQVTIVTNSLAANNQFAVHGGYAPSRKPLLAGGVEIFEVRPDADVAGAEIVAASGAKATLHTKAFLVDNREVFIGSFNFDPRSANINTESGVIIRSPELALAFEKGVREALDQETYELFLTDDGKLRWHSRRDGTDDILHKEPETSWYQRFMAGFMRLLPIRSQL
ncbi:MAG: phospholipase D family protein [Pseudomonadota bacterium]